MIMSATTCPNPTKLRALSLGQLSDEESDALFEHLHSCSECRSEMETVEDGEDSLAASLREPVAGQSPCDRHLRRGRGWP